MKLRGPWLKILCFPLAVNLIVWGLIYLPLRNRLQRWQQVRMLIEEKPKLESLLQESRQVIASWEPARFSEKDSSAVAEALQRMAGRHDLEVKNIRLGGPLQAGAAKKKNRVVSGQSAPVKAGGFSPVAVDLELEGNFARLTRWINEVESQYGLQIDSWSIRSGREPGKPVRMTARLTAFLGGGSLLSTGQAAQGSLERTTRQLEHALRSHRQLAQENKAHDGVFRRDPMQPLVDAQGKQVGGGGSMAVGREGMWIQGIIWSPGRPLVVVNDQLFGQGDSVGPYKILTIHPDRVVAQRGDQSETISLDRTPQEDAISPPGP